MTRGDKHTEVDTSDISYCPAPPSKELVAIPVNGGSSGEGLPYAPQDWPQPGDKWRWKVGYRACSAGTWIDRCVFLPSHYPRATGSRGFQSRVSLEKYIRTVFPKTDVEAFFSSFLWKVPVSGQTKKKENSHHSLPTQRKQESGLTMRAGDCKAENKLCSLNMNTRSPSLAAKPCDVCCTEAGFCRNCSCILCARSIDWASAGGHSFIKCEATLDESYICGHVAHIDCALRCYSAGTVGGCIDLDVQYYCRRCDNKSDLIPHVTKLIKSCKCLDSKDEISKILTIGLCLLRNPKQARAVNLQDQIQTVMAKLKGGVHLDDIWKVEDDIPAFSAEVESRQVYKATTLGVAGIKRKDKPGDTSYSVDSSQREETSAGRLQTPVYITSDHSNASLKFEDDVDQVLKKLKELQESEYKIAEKKLHTQKDLLLSLYQQIGTERSKITSVNGGNDGAHVAKVSALIKQIEYHKGKLDVMLKIAGQPRKWGITEHLGLHFDD